jgi:aminoglycoside/choline kinase family phosphotransferase
MISEALLQHTTIRFPDFARNQIRIEPLEKGGSDRKYYRIAVAGAHSLILVKYNDQREENRHYVAIAQFLERAGVRVPRIYFHDEGEGLIWMQDLGEEDLWASRAEPWPIRRSLYRSALAQVARLHADGMALLPEAGLTLQKEFNAELYHWEQEYFFENCLGRHFGARADAVERAPFLEMAAGLAEKPRVLVHRDFQSQNIMIRGADAWLIDFQGLRPGLPQYDLASLLYDPYVTFTAGERRDLLDDYLTLAAENGLPIRTDFHETLRACAIQRLMQALGAYGFLGHVKARAEFLPHIPVALASLREVVAEEPALAGFQAVLATLPG